jgi:hypothetical protein
VGGAEAGTAMGMASTSSSRDAGMGQVTPGSGQRWGARCEAGGWHRTGRVDWGQTDDGNDGGGWVHRGEQRWRQIEETF